MPRQLTAGPALTAGLALIAGLLLSLSGCTGTNSDSASSHPVTGDSDFPRTIEIPTSNGDSAPLTLQSEPQFIAALDYESAEVLAELGLGDRLVLVPEAVTRAPLGGHIETMVNVSASFPTASNIDPELVIESGADLVVMSPRHGAEETIGVILEQAGVTTLELPDSWTSPETVTTNINLIGQVVGREAAANELVEELSTGLRSNSNDLSTHTASNAPRILVLTNQAGRPFITAGRAYPLELLQLAGAIDAGSQLGLRTTGPITVEQIIEADPDGILLIDMNGTADRLYRELLDNPAIQALSATQSDRVLRISGRQVQALGLQDTITGLATLRDWVQAWGG